MQNWFCISDCTSVAPWLSLRLSTPSVMSLHMASRMMKCDWNSILSDIAWHDLPIDSCSLITYDRLLSCTRPEECRFLACYPAWLLKESTFRKNVAHEPLRSSETSVLIRATPSNMPVDDIPHSHCSENFKSYIVEDLSRVFWSHAVWMCPIERKRTHGQI
jgi:hypothetical protein